MKKYILPALLLMSFVNGSEIMRSNTKIVGGTVVPQTDDTWRAIVALKNGNFQFCAGDLITPKWVLTAAHCVEEGNTNFTVGVNSYNRNTTIAHTVAQVIVHSDYGTDNDIALIELDEAVEGVTPIAYDTASDDRPAGTAAETAGWGRTSSGGPSSDDLLEVSVPLIDRDICNGPDSYAGEVTENMICAGRMSGGVDSCQGDSGGPLVSNNTLIGIVSWGYGCAAENLPGVYTNVKKYASWISENIDNTPPVDFIFETGHPYANNEDITQEICVADGYTGPAKVTITGELESNYDFVTISGDSTRYSGALDESIEVESSCVTVHFTSDGSIVKEGVVVTIEPQEIHPVTDTFETNHPYANNEDITQEICVAEEDYYDGAVTYVRLTGELESNYDFITISGVVRRFTGVLDEYIFEIDGNRCVTVHFTSDSSIVKEGIVATIDIGAV